MVSVTLTSPALLREARGIFALELDAPVAGVYEGRVDYWSFEGAADRTVSVTASSSDVVMGLDVMSPVGEMVVRTGYPHWDHALVRLPVDGRYVIRVWGRDGDTAGAYRVGVRSLALPPAIEMGTPAAGTLVRDSSEAGFWAFENANGGWFRISVVADGFEPVISLYSLAGERLSWGVRVDDEEDVRLEALLAPGRYVILVTAAYDQSSSREGEYEVMVEPVAGSQR